MNIRRQFMPALIPIVALAAVLVSSGCQSSAQSSGQPLDQPLSQPSGPATGTESNSELDNQDLSCSSERASDVVVMCLSENPQRDKILKTLLAWGRNDSRWTDLLINSSSFEKRYHLSNEEMDCLKKELCEEIQSEN